VADLKRAEKPIRVGITGPSGISLPITVILGDALGFRYTFVSGYPGSSATMTGTIRGDSDMTIFNPSSARSFVESGDLIPLFVLDSKRDPTLPDVPTSTELGLPEHFTGLEYLSRLVGAPPNIPEPIANYYGELIPKVLADPDFIAWAKEAKRPLNPAGPEEATASVKRWEATYGKYAEAIKAEVKKLGG
jgi:tripartite-type tricarboxylate transporter receptor subunit TctC